MGIPPFCYRKVRAGSGTELRVPTFTRVPVGEAEQREKLPALLFQIY